MNSPYWTGVCVAVGQAFQPDTSEVRLESLTYNNPTSCPPPAGRRRAGPERNVGETIPQRGRLRYFRYDVVRVWEQPIAEMLAAGLAVLPLAPVADVGPDQVPGVLMAISERLVRETTSPEQAATLWAATKVLMGLRYSKEQVAEFTRGVSAMILGGEAEAHLVACKIQLEGANRGSMRYPNVLRALAKLGYLICTYIISQGMSCTESRSTVKTVREG